MALDLTERQVTQFSLFNIWQKFSPPSIFDKIFTLQYLVWKIFVHYLMRFSPVQYMEKIKQNHENKKKHLSYLYVIYTPGQSVVSKQKDEMEKNERGTETARLLKMENGNSKTFHIWEMGNERKLFHINYFFLRKAWR